METSTRLDRWPENHHPRVTRIFRTGLYAWVALSFLIFFPDATKFWGSDVVFTKNWHPLFPGLLFDLLPGLRKVAPLAVLIPVVLSLLGIYWWRSRLLAIAIGYVLLSFHDVARFALDGGHSLAWFLVIYNVFLDPRPRAPELSRFVSMCGFLTLRAQIVFIYLTTGLAKLFAPGWQDGEAVYYVFALDVFSFPLLQQWVAVAPVLLLKLFGYSVIAFQLSFPILTWHKKLRPYMLLVGFCVYLGIMGIMGLVTFGLIMILTHTLFLDEDDARRLRDLIARKVVRKVGKPG